MIWVLVIGATWLLLGAAVALLIARSIHLADAKAAADAAPEPDVVVDPAPTQPDTPVVLPFPAPTPEAETAPVNGDRASQVERTRSGRRTGIG